MGHHLYLPMGWWHREKVTAGCSSCLTMEWFPLSDSESKIFWWYFKQQSAMGYTWCIMNGLGNPLKVCVSLHRGCAIPLAIHFWFWVQKRVVWYVMSSGGSQWKQVGVNSPFFTFILNSGCNWEVFAFFSLASISYFLADIYFCAWSHSSRRHKGLWTACLRVSKTRMGYLTLGEKNLKMTLGKLKSFLVFTERGNLSVQISSAWFRRLSWEHLPAESAAWYCNVEKDLGLEHLRQSSQHCLLLGIAKWNYKIELPFIEIWDFPALCTESAHHSDPRGQWVRVCSRIFFPSSSRFTHPCFLLVTAEWARNKEYDLLFVSCSGTENQITTFLKAIRRIVEHIQSSPSISWIPKWSGSSGTFCRRIPWSIFSLIHHHQECLVR